jgi:NAD-dependent SIR2 family protein deacetylase
MKDRAPLGEAHRLLAESRSTVAFTGAGVSTASGVPDFRSPGGIWSRYQPVTIQEFMASEEARRRYWRYKMDTYGDFAAARPNAAHHALARLEIPRAASWPSSPRTSTAFTRRRAAVRSWSCTARTAA